MGYHQTEGKQHQASTGIKQQAGSRIGELHQDQGYGGHSETLQIQKMKALERLPMSKQEQTLEDTHTERHGSHSGLRSAGMHEA